MCDYKHPNQKKVINRMSRIIGHAEAIKKMLEEERDCSEVLIQISAVKSALNNVGKLVLKDHINHCVLEIIEDENDEILEKLDDAIDKFIK
ncbi:DNA-binding FrmR family transcriptional regulator [Acetoanaerobium pronyense]|jgi:DNA-binding FrmR family transcriptional regulator|uniref:DNA-binding FrmR family transcriptional regulator n=1 Tax=Acetoanaerobium pronyense TaxID=1482736 RepID=A0ABS4KLF8_9FIRM|nr:metal-sensing transcriptional repressor [Acetoanaerobium pronyense]MBP2028622.1 DNA-binding FrmR family transcriptional regulator [Acetoanaerobium pronyense]